MEFYDRDLNEYARRAARLSMLHHGAYILLMEACYDREQFPTRDEAIEWLMPSSAQEIEAIDFVLKRFFVLEAKTGRWIHYKIPENLYDAAAAEE